MPSSYSRGSIWSCDISPPFSTHQFKAVPVLHSRHVDHRDGGVFAIFIGVYNCRKSRGLQCGAQWNEAFGESFFAKNYFLALFVVFFYVPIAMLTIVYSIIVIKLKSQKRPGEQSTNAEQQRAKRNRNVLKMAIAIVLGFILFWVLRSIGSLLLSFARDGLPWGFFKYWFITFLPFFNCAINPCICFIFSSNYRNALKRPFRCFGGVAQNE